VSEAGSTLPPAGVAGPTPRPGDRRRVRAIARRSGSSFFWAMRFLPARRRRAIHALYAFCRTVDDMADDPGREPAARRAGLEAWRAALAGRGRPPEGGEAVLRALDAARAEFDLPAAELEAVIDGVAMDAAAEIHDLDEAAFTLYCRRVAGAVGMLSVRIFGLDGPEADRLAEAEGEALQITNILRDLAEDAGRGRCYLPAEILDAHGIAARAPAEVLAHPALPAVCADLAVRARARYGEAEAALAALPPAARRRARPAWIMLGVYRALLDRLVAAGWRDPHRRIRLGGVAKLALALRYALGPVAPDGGWRP